MILLDWEIWEVLVEVELRLGLIFIPEDPLQKVGLRQGGGNACHLI